MSASLLPSASCSEDAFTCAFFCRFACVTSNFVLAFLLLFPGSEMVILVSFGDFVVDAFAVAVNVVYASNACYSYSSFTCAASSSEL